VLLASDLVLQLDLAIAVPRDRAEPAFPRRTSRLAPIISASCPVKRVTVRDRLSLMSVRRPRRSVEPRARFGFFDVAERHQAGRKETD
jgi:hypothetical protein